MKIYLSHASSFDYQNELYLPIKLSQIFSQHHFILPHDNSAEPINSKAIIEQCDLMIAEVSFPSTGQGIEIGWADFLNIPIYGVYKTDKKYSSSLKYVLRKTYSYPNKNELVNCFDTLLLLR